MSQPMAWAVSGLSPILHTSINQPIHVLQLPFTSMGRSFGFSNTKDRTHVWDDAKLPCISLGPTTHRMPCETEKSLKNYCPHFYHIFYVMKDPKNFMRVHHLSTHDVKSNF